MVLTGDDINNAFDVTWSTSDSTAVDAGTLPGSNDYDGAASSTISFDGNATSETETVSIVVNDDIVVEADEAFFVNLLSATSNDISFADALGVGTILNDDFLGGRVFDDLDNDGAFEPADGDAGI